MTRQEYLNWCKERALVYVERGELNDAWLSMVSDLKKHEETKDHPAITLGTMMMALGQINTQGEMEKFIKGFN